MTFLVFVSFPVELHYLYFKTDRALLLVGCFRKTQSLNQSVKAFQNHQPMSEIDAARACGRKCCPTFFLHLETEGPRWTRREMEMPRHSLHQLRAWPVFVSKRNASSLTSVCPRSAFNQSAVTTAADRGHCLS